MKVFKNKLTGRLGETQFQDNAEVLIKNAKSADFKDTEIEIIEIIREKYMETIRLQNPVLDLKLEFSKLITADAKIDFLAERFGLK